MVQFSKAYWIVIGLMAATFGINSWIRSPQKSNAQAVNLQHFPKQLHNWVAEEYTLDDRVERVLRTDQTLWRYYTDTNGKRVELFVAYYRDQKFGAQVHSPQHCLPGSGWTILRHGDIQLPLDTIPAHAKQLHIAKNDENQLVAYWFYSGGNFVQNEFGLKIRLLTNALRGRTTSVYFYRVSVPFAADQEKEALQTLMAFVAVAGPYFNTQAVAALVP